MIDDLEPLSSIEVIGRLASPAVAPHEAQPTDREPPELSSWRHDPLTDRQVRIAAGRAERPNDFVGDGSTKEPCPFCGGAEDRTPNEVDRVDDASGNWLARAVPNRFPAVEGADGVHEVVIESPRHIGRYVDLTPEEQIAAVASWARRLERWHGAPEFDYRLMFKNEGPAAGASMSHTHSQILAFPEAPPSVGPMWDRIAAEPDTLGGLPISSVDGWLVTSPPAPRGSYEAWLMPADATRRFTEDDAASLAPVLAWVIQAIGADDFNLVLQAPPKSAPATVHTLWWLEVIPRTSAIAGVELATGRWINAVSPELAAETLRERIEGPRGGCEG